MTALACYIDRCQQAATYFVHSYPDNVRLCNEHKGLHPVEIGETLCILPGCWCRGTAALTADAAAELGYCPTCIGAHRVAHPSGTPYFGATVLNTDACPDCADRESIARTVAASLAALETRTEGAPS